MNTTLRCGHCKDVIGVYEPIIVLRDGQALSTSRGAELRVAGDMNECYHRDCWVQLHGEAPHP